MPNEVAMVAAIVGMLVFLTVAVAAATLMRPWLRAALSGAPVTLVNTLGMRLRGTPAALVVDAYVQLRARGVETSVAGVERIYLAQRQRVREPLDLVELVERSEQHINAESAE